MNTPDLLNAAAIACLDKDDSLHSSAVHALRGSGTNHDLVPRRVGRNE